jgi:hypothetical protein
METHKFKYPIFPDRLYTIKERDTGKEIEVYGDILIAAYLLYTESLIPSEISHIHIDESPL